MKFRFTTIQLIAHVACLIPFSLLIFGFYSNTLTVNPIREITDRTGRTAILIFLLSFGCRPIRQFFDMDSILLIRKTLGLYAAFYAGLHFLNYIGLDFQFNWPVLIRLFSIQLFLQIGLVAAVILFLLAFFSIPFIQKKLSGFWKKARLLIYLSFGLSLLHFFMATKGDKIIPETHLLIFILFSLFHLPPINKLQIKLLFLQKINSLLKSPLLPHG